MSSEFPVAPCAWTGDTGLIGSSRFIIAPDVDIVSCVTDPRCVAKDHYTPPVDAEDLSVGIPDAERGVIPIWALQIHDYVRSHQCFTL